MNSILPRPRKYLFQYRAVTLASCIFNTIITKSYTGLMKLNLSDRFQTQNIETFSQYKRCCFGQQYSSSINFHDFTLLVLFNTVAVIVEFSESSAYIVDILAQMVYTKVLRHFRDYIREFQQDLRIKQSHKLHDRD